MIVHVRPIVPSNRDLPEEVFGTGWYEEDHDYWTGQHFNNAVAALEWARSIHHPDVLCATVLFPHGVEVEIDNPDYRWDHCASCGAEALPGELDQDDQCGDCLTPKTTR